MRTDTYPDRTHKNHCIAPKGIDPSELWLDQDTTGEELIALDPLEDAEDLLALAEEATGDFLKQLWLNPVSRCNQQAKNGTETPADFIKRISGSQ